MSDPAIAIHDAIKPLVVAATATGPAKGRVHYRVPTGAAFPFVHIADNDLMGDEESFTGWVNVTTTIHVFSRSADQREAKMVGSQVRAAFATPFALTGGFEIAEGPFTDATYFTDPDGLTEHGVITVTYKVVPTA